ncbi:flippase [Spirochaetia bacterium]|nr:flippase [Spirochaetia bacterium]
MPKEKSITRVLIWQTAGRFILQGIGFITAPIFTRLLTPSDYGQIAVYTAWVSLCSLFVGLQTHGSIANAKIKYGDNKIDGYLSSIMTLSVISFAALLIISIVANGFFARLLGLRSDLVVLLVIQSFASFCIAFYTAKLIQYKQAERSTLLSLIVSLLSTGLSVGFLFLISENRYIVKIYTNAIPTVIIGSIIVFYVYIKGKRLFDKQYLKYCLSLTLPLILHGAGGLILSQSDRVMLQKMIGESSAGIYSFAYTVALVIFILWVSFNTTWVPFYYEYKKNNSVEMILLRTRNYTIVFSIVTMGFILLSPEVYRLMAPKEYWSGIQLIPLIAIAYYFNFLYAFPANFEFYNEKTKLISLGTIFAAIINVVCNFLLIPVYAGMGAAIATLISFVFLFAFHEIIARFVIKKYENKFGIYCLGLLPIAMTVFLFYSLQDLWFIRWGIGLILGIYLLHRIIRRKAIF